MNRVTPQVCAGAIFAVIGAIGIVLARGYALGTATHMGPGYFPTCLSVLLLLLGLGAILQSLLRGGGTSRLPAWEFADLGFLLLGVVLFGLLIDSAGLVAAVAGLILPACYWRLLRRPIEVAAVFVVITVFSGLVFIQAFGLPFAWFG